MTSRNRGFARHSGSQTHSGLRLPLSRRWMRSVAVLILAAATLAGQSAAGASGDCGEFSFGFEGTRLLNDGISNSAGPFAISLPAGTYDITLVAHDLHSHDSTVNTQPHEQFVVRLDNGYVSPPSADIPDDIDNTTTVHRAQHIASPAGAISVHHVGIGGVDSVDVLCVGFDPIAEAPAAAPVEAPQDDSSSDSDDATDAAPEEPASVPAASCDAPASGDSSEPDADTTADDTAAAPADGTAEACDVPADEEVAAPANDPAPVDDAVASCDAPAPAADDAAADVPADDAAISPAGNEAEACDVPADDAVESCDADGTADNAAVGAAADNAAAAPADGAEAESCDDAAAETSVEIAAPAAPAPVEVQGTVEIAGPQAGTAAALAQVPELAVTGRSSLSIALFALGLVLIGGSFVLAGDQREKATVGSPA